LIGIGEVSKRKARGRLGRCGVGGERPGGALALDEAVDVGIQGFHALDVSPLMPDLQRAPFCAGCKAQGHLLPPECGVDLVDDAIKAHRAVFLDRALGLEEEDLVEVEGRVWEVHLIGAAGPALQRCLPLQSAVGGVMVLALDPGP